MDMREKLEELAQRRAGLTPGGGPREVDRQHHQDFTVAGGTMGSTVADLDMFERTLENVHRLPSSLVDSYRSRNAASYTLDPTNLDMEQGYVIMPQEEFDQILGRKGARWTDFEARYPGASGMIVFSRVGFNADGDQALADMN